MTASRAGLDRDIERYLLGQMSPEEHDGMEALLFEDDELCRAMEDTEEQLIDRYLSGDLSAEDRRAFEDHFAASSLRQERIAFRRVLPRAVAGRTLEPRLASASAPLPAVGPAEVSPKPRTASLNASSRWVGLAALVVAGLWLAQRREAEPPTPSASPGHAAGVASPLASASDGPQSPHPGSPSVPGASPAPLTPDRPDLVLRAGALRDGGRLPRLVAPLAARVRIDAELEAPSPATDYAVALSTAEGTTVWKGVGRRHPGTSRVTVAIGAEALRPGDFILSVAAPGRPAAETAEYPFAVRGR